MDDSFKIKTMKNEGQKGNPDEKEELTLLSSALELRD